MIYNKPTYPICFLALVIGYFLGILYLYVFYPFWFYLNETRKEVLDLRERHFGFLRKENRE